MVSSWFENRKRRSPARCTEPYLNLECIKTSRRPDLAFCAIKQPTTLASSATVLLAFRGDQSLAKPRLVQASVSRA